MALLSESYPGRSDGSYTLLFGDPRFGELISAVHSTSIKMGNQLEKLIMDRSKLITVNNIDAFFNKTLPEGIWIIPKQVIAKDKRLNFDQKPDMIIVNVNKNTCQVIEMKLGDNFDTKKSKGEVDQIKKYVEKLDKATTYKASFAICMFYAKDRASVVNGFKGQITEKEALTGMEFCEIAGINFKEVNNIISEAQSANRTFFIAICKNLTP
jgi:hypothetical protein